MEDYSVSDLTLILKNKLSDCLEIRSKLASDIDKVPPNRSLRCSSCKGHYQYYLQTSNQDGTDFNQKYIKKKDHHIATLLAQRDYETALLKDVSSIIAGIKKLLDCLSSHDLIKDYQNCVPARKALLTPLFLSDDDYASAWLAEEYPEYDYKREACIFTTLKGDMVRSKSEKIIADTLFRLNIPYKYECPLIIDGKIICCPDFTILNKHTRKVYYLEHFGLLDNYNYYMRNLSKLEVYIKNGIILGSQLIVTAESSSVPFSEKIIESIIQENFQ